MSEAAHSKPTNRSTSSAEDRFGFLTDSETGRRLREVCYLTSSTVSQVVNACLIAHLDTYLKRNRGSARRIRPGRRLKL